MSFRRLGGHRCVIRRRVFQPPGHTAGEVRPPTKEQLWMHFRSNAVPMIGFGFMDQTVMVHAGNAIDLTFGVTFGLSTLTAAACGQICSDVAGVTFGGAIESLAVRAGLTESKLSSKQHNLPEVKRWGFVGRLVGVIIGCVLGLGNLFFIDASRTQQLKLEARSDNEHSVHVSNRERRDATTVTVDGPDTDGLVASIATTLASAGYSLIEIQGGPDGDHLISDVFVVQKNGERVDDTDLDALARCVVDACRKPKKALALQADNTRLIDENFYLRTTLESVRDELETIQHERRVKIARSNTTTMHSLSSPSLAFSPTKKASSTSDDNSAEAAAALAEDETSLPPSSYDTPPTLSPDHEENTLTKKEDHVAPDQSSSKAGAAEKS